jgi:tRNA-modifying protein YgfZ
MDVTASATQMTIPTFTRQLRPDRTILRLSGSGVLAFLNNLLTREVLHLPEGEGAYAALLTPQGKILHDVFVIHRADVVFIDCAAAQADDLLQKLKQYRLRAKIDMQRPDDLGVAVSPAPDMHGLCYADPRAADMGFRAVIEKGSADTGTGYDELRLKLGIADSVADIGTDTIFVHEANLDQLNGVSFSKGCYVGQEVVSRIHHRHMARNRILPVQMTGPVAAGTGITSGDKRIGTMLSSIEGHGLALLRLDRLAEAELPLLAADAQLSVHRPDWADFDVQIPETAQ